MRLQMNAILPSVNCLQEAALSTHGSLRAVDSDGCRSNSRGK